MKLDNKKTFMCRVGIGNDNGGCARHGGRGNDNNG